MRIGQCGVEPGMRQARENEHDVIERFLLWHYNYLLHPYMPVRCNA